MQHTPSRTQVEVFQVSGHLNAANAAELQTQLTTAVTANRNSTLLVDMAQLDSLDSAGLMVLVSALCLAQRSNCRLSLCAIAPSVRIIFELTQLDRVFEIFDSRAAFAANLN